MSADREACCSFFRNVFDAEAGAECGLYLESIRFLLTWIRRDLNSFISGIVSYFLLLPTAVRRTQQIQAER